MTPRVKFTQGITRRIGKKLPTSRTTRSGLAAHIKSLRKSGGSLTNAVCQNLKKP